MNRLKFVRVGLPFFAIVIGGAYGLHFFQRVRFDFRKIKQEDENLETLVSSFFYSHRFRIFLHLDKITLGVLVIYSIFQKTDLTNSGVRLREGVTVETVYKVISFSFVFFLFFSSRFPFLFEMKTAVPDF